MFNFNKTIIATSALFLSVSWALADDTNLEQESSHGFTLEVDEVRNETTAYLDSILAKINSEEIEIKPIDIEIREDLDIEWPNGTSWHYIFKTEEEYNSFMEIRNRLSEWYQDFGFNLIVED